MDSHEATRLALSEAIALALDGRLSHSAAARELGLGQPTVSRWVSGASRPSLEDLERLEVICGRPRGFILSAAGYVGDVTTVEEALAMDAALDDVGRAVVLAAYHGVTGHHSLIDRPAADPSDGSESEF